MLGQATFAVMSFGNRHVTRGENALSTDLRFDNTLMAPTYLERFSSLTHVTINLAPSVCETLGKGNSKLLGKNGGQRSKESCIYAF